MRPGNKITPGEITVVGGGAVALVFSFFDFYTPTFGSGFTVWSSGFFPAYTLMVIFVVIMALQVVLSRFTSARPDPPFGFTWEQLHLLLGFVAMVYAIAFFVTERNPVLDFGIGFWGILVGCVGAFVGAVLLRRERGGGSGLGY